MKKAIYWLAVLVLLAVALWCGWNIYGILGEYRQAEKTYEDLNQYVSIPDPTWYTVPTTPSFDPSATEENMDGTETEPTLPQDHTLWPVVDFVSLKKINRDIVAWIYIEGTDVNYPVVQGSDNDYYLHHMFDGSYNYSGSIFLDAACTPDFSDRHSIIHGHHMLNDTMFSALMGYKEQSFYDAHPTVLILTPYSRFKAHLFSGYVTDTDADAWDLTPSSKWPEQVAEKSWFDSNNLPLYGEEILTLSTCSYEFDDARFVLHGWLEECP